MKKPPRPSNTLPKDVTARYGVAQRVVASGAAAHQSTPRATVPEKVPAKVSINATTPATVGASAQRSTSVTSSINAPGSASLRGNSGIASDRARLAMVERLRQQGIRDPKVLAAMATIPRQQFVDEGLASRAYEDTALPIGHGQTISQPGIVARMIEILRASALMQSAHTQKILEIGTGCGYQAAILGLVFSEVYSIERIRGLHELAKHNLRPLRLPNVRLSYGDGMLGLPQAAPFDGMILAAAGLALPDGLLSQIKVGGKIVAPVQQADGRQFLQIYEQQRPGEWTMQQLEEVRFVPLLSGTIRE